MERPDDLPDFDDPPVDEVVVGAFHDKVAGYADGLPVKFLNALSDLGYETFELQDRLVNLDVEPTKPPELRRAPQIQLVNQRESPRVWLATADERRLIQVQDDVLVVNWRRRGDVEYPRFEPIVDDYLTLRDRWSTVLSAAGLSMPPPSVLEVTYINWIEDMAIPEFFRPAAAASLTSSENVETSPESSSWKASHALRNGTERVGRLNVECASAARISADDEVRPGARFSLSTKIVAPADGQIADAMNLGRCAIVRAFADLTTERAHDRWRRIK